MIRKDSKKIEKKTISLFEIFVLVAGIVAFAYFVGDEFKVVSAASNLDDGSCEGIKSGSFRADYKDAGGIIHKVVMDDPRNCVRSASSCPSGMYQQYCRNGEWETCTCITEKKTTGKATCTYLSKTFNIDDKTTEGCDKKCGSNCDVCERSCLNGGKWGNCICTTKTAGDTTAKDDISSSLLPFLGGTLIPKETAKQAVAAGATGENLATTAAATETGKQVAEQVITGETGLAWDKFAFTANNAWFNLAANLAVAVGLYFGVKQLALLSGWNPQLADQAAWWLAGGYGVGSTIAILGSLFTEGGAILGGSISVGVFAVPWLGIVGLGLGILGCLLFCKEAKYQQITFTCNPWQPATGGADCQKCNQGQFPCTSYKCQSLGQGCELLNPGTNTELCDWVNKNDIAPPTITSWNGPLPDGYSYTPDTATLPPDKGVKITTTGGCIPPFTKLTYGISLDKPGRCRMEVNSRTDDYASMSFPISNGLYKYNHTLLAFHGGTSESEAEGFNIPNGGNYEVYIRCESRNGYSNEGTFVFKYCVDDEPDRTAPEIMLTDPLNGWPIKFGQISEDVNVYTDKPAECRWSHSDEDFDLMAGTMDCDQSITEVNANLLYQCQTTLTGLLDSVDNKFYFRCKSYPLNPEEERYKNEESYVYTLVGTRALVIDWAKPDGITIKGATDSVQVTLGAHTSAGYKDGKAICYFKEATKPDTSYVQFANTNTFEHSQDLWFTEGGYDYSIRCCDLGGNCAVEDISFIVDTDRDAPIVARVYNDNKKLKIITNEEAECVYDLNDCTYNFEDGVAMTTTNKIEHTTDWNTNSDFYIKCKDKFANEPFPNECSIIARPFSGY
ncbi:MAG: hypothetical protein PHQ66_03470 [Candidatus Nanoarchaeia archaeon]|nr:hypothetical protein [Candidatus Nanoarchaeia archaeon]MDD5357578.1 hypothetical protein [Candidatus Nanoarchaeia archaeon]MDD5588497.1 hypothetical protein [Candidatus Nanoarchaeia archaeon]